MLSDQDKLFAQYAINKGFISKQILNHYLAQKNISTLQNYLQENKLLTLEQIAIVHREIQSSACPATIERYTILQKIGQGGMGCVYKVQDKQLQRTVALKTISPESNYNVQRFLREARTMASLKHPNILNVIDLGIDERGQPYFTMEYIDGKTLKERSLSTRKIIAIMIEVCKAMQHAHQQGVIHRDLKPSNIMLDGNKPIIMDFGLAKIEHSDKKLSKSGQVIGTLQYMPPEQALGRGSAIDHRSDIYSLGAILFYLLTGVPPFTGSSINVIFQLTQEKVKFSANLKKRIPQQLQDICLKAMAKEKDDRYQSADELAHDLNSFLQGKEVEAHKQKQFATIKQLSFAILCISLIAGWIFFARPKSKANIDQQNDLVEIITPKELSVFRGDISRSGVYSVTNINNAKIENPKSSKSLKSQTGAISPLNLVENVLYYGNYHYQKKVSNLIIQNQDLKLKGQYSLPSQISSFPLVIENLIYFGTKDGHFYCLDIKNGFPEQRWKLKLTNTVRFDSPICNKRLVYVSDSITCYALNMYTGKKVWQLTGKLITSPTIFEGILYIGDENTLYALNPENGQEIWHTKTKVSCTPAINSNRIFYHSTDKAHCRNLQGDLLWSTPSASNFSTEKLFSMGPTLCNDKVYWLLKCHARSNVDFNEIHAMQDHDGKLEWQTIIPGLVSHSPILVKQEQKDILFVTNNTAHVFGLDSKSGKEILHYQVISKQPATATFSPIVYGQSIYIPSHYKIEKKNFLDFVDQHQPLEINESSIEGEHFDLKSSEVEDMSHWGSWSNGKQLYWNNKSQGRRLNKHFIVPEEGEYTLYAYFTRNKHYGKHQVTINYEFPSSTPPLDLYTKENGYHRYMYNLGTYTLYKGQNIFTVSCVGKNRNAKDYRFGLDNIVLEPTKKAPSHLIAYFPFDKDHKDHSIFQNEVQGDVPIASDGIKGKCANFHEKSFLILKEKAAIKQKLTFCVWLYHENLPKFSPILSKFSPNKRSSYRFILSSQIPTLQLWGPSQNTLSPVQLRVPNKKWYMLAVTYNGTKAKFYIDGKWKRSINLHGKIAESLNDLHIGFTDDHPTPFTFQGKMDELRIYNRVLTAEEIANLYK